MIEFFDITVGELIKTIQHWLGVITWYGLVICGWISIGKWIAGKVKKQND